MTHTDVLNFWFKELTPEQWWVKDEQLDQTITAKFSDLLKQAKADELSSWRTTPEGSLAEVIVLDQFSRNIYRDTAKAFEADAQALELAKDAINKGFDQKLTTTEKSFLYLPFMHSEDASVHEEAVKLYSQEGLEHNYDFELKHKVIIDQFGRYPHRNNILGRTSTPEEIEFLKQPNSSF